MTIYVHKVLQRPYFSIHTPNFTIINQNRGKRAVFILLRFVCRLKLQRALRAFSFLLDPESFPVKEISHSLKIPFPSLQVSKFSEGECSQIPDPPSRPHNKLASPARVFKRSPPAVEIALRLPCYYICVASATDEYCTYSNFVQQTLNAQMHFQ